MILHAVGGGFAMARGSTIVLGLEATSSSSSSSKSTDSTSRKLRSKVGK